MTLHVACYAQKADTPVNTKNRISRGIQAPLALLQAHTSEYGVFEEWGHLTFAYRNMKRIAADAGTGT